MIITLTPNTGIDHTVEIPGFRLNSTIRAIDSAWGMGGKATDVSWTLGKLGIPTRALGFAAGPNGVRMEKMLRERGVETDFVWVDGETRLNSIIVVPGEGQSTITSSSLNVALEHLSADAFTRVAGNPGIAGNLRPGVLGRSHSDSDQAGESDQGG